MDKANYVRVYYGPYRHKTLVDKARKARDWQYLKSLKLISNYKVYKDWVRKSFLVSIHTSTGQHLTIVTCTAELREFFMSHTRSRKLGYDAQQMLMRAPANQFYLDKHSRTNIRNVPTPLYEFQYEKNPSWKKIDEKVGELMAELPQDMLDYYSSCVNTFEACVAPDEDGDDKFKKVREERFDTLQSMSKMTITTMIDLFGDEWQGFAAGMLLHATALQMEEGAEGHAPHIVEMNLGQLHLQGMKNSSKGGQTSNIPAHVGAQKSTYNWVSTIEALTTLGKLGRSELTPIAPYTCEPKDELVKPGKKQKQFQSEDAPSVKTNRILHGAESDAMSGALDIGSGVGLSSNGASLDTYMRYLVNGMAGKSLTNDELLQTEAIGTDFEAFEYRLNPAEQVILHTAKILTKAPFYGTDGIIDKRCQGAAALLAEQETLPCIRMGGGNLVFKVGAGFRPSGTCDTLKENTLTNHMQLLKATMAYLEKHPEERSADNIMSIIGPKLGDDGILLATEYTKNLMTFAQEHIRPMKLKVEKVGPLISTLDENGRLLNGGVDFCKNNLVLDEEYGTICGQRRMENLAKVFRGNTTDRHPLKRMSGCCNQMYNADGNKLAQEHLRKLYLFLRETYPEYKDQIHAEDQPSYSITDPDDAAGEFPTPQEVRERLRRPDKQRCQEILHNTQTRIRFKRSIATRLTSD